MIRCEGLGELPPLTNPVATLGAFDGVHLGHQRVIRTVMDWARELGGQSVVMTFDRHPRRVIEGRAPALITSVAHRLRLFESLGVDAAVVLRFDKALADLSAEDFVRRYLVEWLGVKAVVLGFDCAFGKGRRGDLALLQRLGAQYGFQARSCPPVEIDGQVVSSTAVRRLVEQGEFEAAGRMLGRPFSLLGTVVPGAGLGRRLGFPTANLDLHHEVMPPDGVYLSRARAADRTYPALTNIGARPTVAAQAGAPRLVEVYLEGLDRDIYGEELEVRFVRKLRDEIAFEDLDALQAQMRADRDVLLRELGRG